MDAIGKYLNHYAEMEVGALPTFPSKVVFNHCIAIPACNEKIDFIHALENSPIVDNTLLVVIINQSPHASTNTANANATLFKELNTHYKTVWQQSNIQLLQKNKLHIALVDRFTPGREIAEKEGVGRARKIACDIATHLYYKGNLLSSWIYSSDADASLPHNYFSTQHTFQNAAAQVFDFMHIGEPGATLNATQLYERAIKYYRRGLVWAKSPYAFYTLGSTLAVNILAYCQVRGFPARSGGEDFYLLNKLAKVGDVVFSDSIVIQIQARLSQRVPFGTGPAVKNILALQEKNQAYCYYNPHIFTALKTVLALKNPIVDHPKTPHALEALHKVGLTSFAKHCQTQSIKPEDIAKQFTIWFDSFRTLKFIRFLQENAYPPLPIRECETKLDEQMANSC